MKTPRYHHAAIVLNDGNVPVTVGVGVSGLINEANECTIDVELLIVT